MDAFCLLIVNSFYNFLHRPILRLVAKPNRGMDNYLFFVDIYGNELHPFPLAAKVQLINGNKPLIHFPFRLAVGICIIYVGKNK